MARPRLQSSSALIRSGSYFGTTTALVIASGLVLPLGAAIVVWVVAAFVGGVTLGRPGIIVAPLVVPALIFRAAVLNGSDTNVDSLAVGAVVIMVALTAIALLGHVLRARKGRHEGP